MEATYLIPSCNLSYLSEKLADLNKRAHRIGSADITMETELAFVERQYQMLTVTGEINRDVWVREGNLVPSFLGLSAQPTGAVRDWLNVTIKGETPKYEGWSLIAVLEPLDTEDGAENIIQAVPGHECPTAYRDRAGQCDHCNTSRRRNQTFVVKHDNGEHRMVGRQCLRDFLGHTNPHSLASMAELLASMESMFSAARDEDWMGGWSRTPSSWDLETFLRWASSSIRTTGWTSASSAYEMGGQSTKSHVLYLMTPPAGGPDSSQEWKRDVERCAPSESDENRARRALEWALDINREDENLSDYLYNVNLIARSSYVNRKTAGVAASIIFAYSRWEEREIERARQATYRNEHVGQLKLRQEFTLDCVGIYETEGNYGVTSIHRLRDAEGRSLVWFASGSAKNLEVGQRYRVKATVKSHGEYRGTLQTNVSRLAVVEELGETPEAPVVAVPAVPQVEQVLTAPVRFSDVL